MRSMNGVVYIFVTWLCWQACCIQFVVQIIALCHSKCASLLRLLGSLCIDAHPIRLHTVVHRCADVQGLVLRLLTYLGLKYCNQRSKHNPVARAFTRMWMRVRFYSKLHWWSMPSTPRSASSLPVQELSHALDHQHQKDFPAKLDIATPLLAQAVPF